MDHNPACVICFADLWDDELGRLICRPCEQRIDYNLRQIAGPSGLYARLCLRTTPGKNSDGPVVSGTRGAPIPPNLHILNLVAGGGIVSDLETWVDDWASHGLTQPTHGGRLQHRVDHAVRALRLGLPRAAERHPALKNFSDEIQAIIRRCQPIICDEKPLQVIRVACPCGRTISLTLATTGETCTGCHTTYDQRAVKELPLIARRAA
ncbi:hypothetical protein [Streptomyces sp. CS081A]|uniref:hypothetical protein n=1 Tax=Streptomyces sp. CS081A TaxID=2162709 RepID=UPI000D5110F2|nr:hypothetical protein [Streptomyces sp. CS081A]PVC73499.1 hypothetical protein DBP18_14225 [Streptomyces sp. CS081A]